MEKFHVIKCLLRALRRPRIALMGVREFREDLTTSYMVHDWNELKSYDAGRELAHIFTLRRFDEAF